MAAAKTATETAPTLSPLEQIAALQAQLKELKSSAGEEMKADAEAKFLPLHERITAAVTSIGDSSNPENAAAALKFLTDNVGDYKKYGKIYHKHVFGVTAPRKPREPKSDTAAAE